MNIFFFLFNIVALNLNIWLHATVDVIACVWCTSLHQLLRSFAPRPCQGRANWAGLWQRLTGQTDGATKLANYFNLLIKVKNIYIKEAAQVKHGLTVKQMLVDHFIILIRNVTFWGAMTTTTQWVQWQHLAAPHDGGDRGMSERARGEPGGSKVSGEQENVAWRPLGLKKSWTPCAACWPAGAADIDPGWRRWQQPVRLQQYNWAAIDWWHCSR